jgi:prevent-host-death family protein
MKVLPISKFKTNLGKSLDFVERRRGAITLTRRGKPVAVILSKNEYDGWQETIEIMKDSEFMKEIRDGIRALKHTKKRYTIDELFVD